MRKVVEIQQDQKIFTLRYKNYAVSRQNRMGNQEVDRFETYIIHVL